MWIKGRYSPNYATRFFRLVISNDTLANYYTTNFTLIQELGYKYTLTELEDMYPFERDIYIALTNRHITEENQKEEQRRIDARQDRL